MFSHSTLRGRIKIQPDVNAHSSWLLMQKNLKAKNLPSIKKNCTPVKTILIVKARSRQT